VHVSCIQHGATSSAGTCIRSTGAAVLRSCVIDAVHVKIRCADSVFSSVWSSPAQALTTLERDSRSGLRWSVGQAWPLKASTQAANPALLAQQRCCMSDAKRFKCGDGLMQVQQESISISCMLANRSLRLVFAHVAAPCSAVRMSHNVMRLANQDGAYAISCMQHIRSARSSTG
jgi:hypothetical protein